MSELSGLGLGDVSLLPETVRGVVEAELTGGERVVWLDQPIAGRMARTGIPAVIFGIPWTAFAIFWTGAAAWGVSQAGEDPGWFRLFPLWGIPFILIGLAMLSSPFWLYRSAKRSVYVLTDRRAIVFTAGHRGSHSIRSLFPASLQSIERKQHADGSGDLVLVRDVSRDNDGDRVSKPIGFLAVRDVRTVEELMRKTLALHEADST